MLIQPTYKRNLDKTATRGTLVLDIIVGIYFIVIIVPLG
jgi:hypothetical protein